LLKLTSNLEADLMHHLPALKMIFFDLLFSIQQLLSLPPYQLAILRTAFWHQLLIDLMNQLLDFRLFG
jgi:hypothetical protein